MLKILILLFFLICNWRQSQTEKPTIRIVISETKKNFLHKAPNTQLIRIITIKINYAYTWVSACTIQLLLCVCLCLGVGLMQFGPEILGNENVCSKEIVWIQWKVWDEIWWKKKQNVIFFAVGDCCCCWYVIVLGWSSYASMWQY